MDRDGLTAARRATPIHRYIVATVNDVVVGYAITGRSNRSSFLQRLGVDPESRRRGIGTLLVTDALLWAHENGAESMLVNTQDANASAVRLYEQLGFTLTGESLMVMERPAPAAVTT